MILSKLAAAKVEEMATGYPKAVRADVSKAVRNGLALMERHHKKKEIKRNAGKSASVANRWSWRTGALAKSFRIFWKSGALEGYYGSQSKYSRMVEGGGTVRPKRAKFLAIPLDAAKYGVGGGVSPRHHRNLFPITSKKGNLLLVKGGAGSIVPMYVLKKMVKIPARPTLKRTEAATIDKATNLIADAAVKSLGGGK